MRRNNRNNEISGGGGGGEEDTWIWGNNRGGGGAPLRNINGEPITNLKGVMNGTIEVDYNSPGNKGNYSPNKRRNNDQSPIRNEYNDRRYHSPIKGNEYTARGHKNMNIDDSERESKARKARDYQEQLREQVEEKKRQKEAEQRELDKVKQKEYNDYIKNHYKGPVANTKHPNDDHYNNNNNNNNNNRGRDRDRDRDRGRGSDDDYDSQKRNDSHHGKFRRDDDYDKNRDYDDHGGKGRNNDYGNDKYSNHREDKYDKNRNNNNGGGGGGGRRGVDNSNGNGRDRGHEYENDDNHRRKGRNNDYDDRENNDQWVSRDEFEELQRDYERLKAEHEELAAQLQLQEEIIEDLRRNKSKFADDSSSVGKVTKNSNPTNGKVNNVKDKKSLISNKKNNIDRDTASDSGIKSTRSHSGVGGHGVKLPNVVNKKQRPSSMHDTPKESKNNKIEKKPNPPNGSKPNKSNSNNEQVGGFKKLQMGLAKKDGPVVITYEDEEQFIQGKQISNASPLITKSGARQSHIPVPTQSKNNNRVEYSELKGASEHFRVNRIDEDGISDDQLERLLLKAKNVRN